jgi:hypothetical protein
MQQATDCDVALVHDDDLGAIGGLGHDSVSGLLNGNHIVPSCQLAVDRNSRTRRDDRSPPEVQHKEK